MRAEAVKRQVGPAIYQAMEPGDQIIAGTLAMPGSAPAWDALAALPAIPVGIAGGINFFTNVSSPIFGVLAGIGVLSAFLMLPLQFRRAPVFVAVTRQQLICYRLSRMGNEPARVQFCAPLASVRITSLGSALPRWRSVRYNGPGADDRGLRLNVHGRWRKDLEEVLAALQSSGAAVEPTPRSVRDVTLPQ